MSLALNKPPVLCVRDQSPSVILAKVHDPQQGEHRWRYRCLDCGAAWWVEDHGGDPDEYQEVKR